MPRTNYDFSGMVETIRKIKEHPDNAKLNALKNELNSFFRDSTCKEVIYTLNTDKMFFGMAVIPNIRDEEVYEIIQDDRQIRIDEYYLELDSKLFDADLNLNNVEILAILLHEIGHIVNDSTPIDVVRKNIDVYLTKNREVLKTSDSAHYKAILSFGIKDAIRKVTSIFQSDDDEVIADQFVVACGFGQELESAFDKIVKNSYNINKNVDNKIIVLAWVLRLYMDVKFRRIAAIKSLRRGQSLTASKLERREMDNVIRRLQKIDDDSLIEAATETGFFKGLAKSITYKNIRSYEDDLYDYNLRVKNVNTEDDALAILHSINVRMSIIDDYVSSENLSENERKRWFNLYNKFQKLREILSNKNTYKSDYSRIYINYPDNIDR